MIYYYDVIDESSETDYNIFNEFLQKDDNNVEHILDTNDLNNSVVSGESYDQFTHLELKNVNYTDGTDGNYECYINTPNIDENSSFTNDKNSIFFPVDKIVKTKKCADAQEEMVDDTKKEVMSITIEPDTGKLKNKKNRLVSPVEKYFQCEFCSDNKYSSNKKLKHHIEKVHYKNKQIIYCHKCSIPFCNKFKLKEHIRRIHDNCKDFHCAHCIACYKSYNGLKNHMKKKHNINFKKYAGSVAIRTTQSPESIPSQVQLTCPVCSKSFDNLLSLHHHETAHNDNKNIKCSICDMSYKYESCLTTHMKNKHPPVIDLKHY